MQISSSLVILTSANKVESILSLTGGGGRLCRDGEGGLSKAARAAGVARPAGAARAAGEGALQFLFTEN